MPQFQFGTEALLDPQGHAGQPKGALRGGGGSGRGSARVTAAARGGRPRHSQLSTSPLRPSTTLRARSTQKRPLGAASGRAWALIMSAGLGGQGFQRCLKQLRVPCQEV